MPAVPEGAFRTVVCAQVLEHAPRPWLAMAEFARVLKPGGVLILSVPHLSAIHEAPHDYFRYTRYGMTALAARAELQVLELREAGGLLSFLAHPLSLGCLSLVAPVPGARTLAFEVNRLVVIRGLRLLDRIAGLSAVLHVLAAKKPDAEAHAC